MSNAKLDSVLKHIRSALQFIPLNATAARVELGAAILDIVDQPLPEEFIDADERNKAEKRRLYD